MESVEHIAYDRIPQDGYTAPQVFFLTDSLWQTARRCNLDFIVKHCYVDLRIHIRRKINRKYLRSFLRPFSDNTHTSGNKANRQQPTKPTDFWQMSQQTGWVACTHNRARPTSKPLGATPSIAGRPNNQRVQRCKQLDILSLLSDHFVTFFKL